MEQSLFS